jgi:TRAP-type C4-dicarboxylate transport system permease small subunit
MTKHGVSDLLKRLEVILTFITGMLFLGVLLITSSNILLRNVLGISWLFMDGLMRLLFIWMVFTGTSVLYSRHDHLIMDFFSGKFSVKVAKAIDLLQSILFMLFLFVLLYYGIQIVRVRMSIPFETWKFPTGYAYAAVPVNAVIMALFCIQRMVRTFTGKGGEQSPT